DLTFNAEKVSLLEIVNKLLPIVKPIVGNLIGFNMDGDDLITIVENALDSYITPSFLVGLGGIASNIVVAFATDVFPDIAQGNDPSVPKTIQPYAEYKYANKAITYVSTNNKVSTVGATVNAATQDNGRVPSRVTTGFDTVDSTTSYTFKFYTEENVYGTFRYKTSVDGEWIEVSTTKGGADKSLDYIDSVARNTTNGITVEMLTQTKPVYVPLIDLGLLCLTHAQVDYDTVGADGKTKIKDVPYKYGERDNAAKNSIIYWNVTTVTISGLKADTTYYYDILGNYEVDDERVYFSFVDYNKLNEYEKDYFTFTTAKDDSATAFEFLTIADIQGMIQGMYTDSFNAMKALIADDRTKDFDFILNAGDMCDNGKNFNQWAQALDTYQTVFANTSTFFTAGNHEDGSNAMANFFNYTLPTDENGDRLQKDVTDGMFYSFNYANAHFVVLCTNDANADGLGEVQYNWLKKDLESSTAKWKFVLMHKSLYSGGSHSTDSEVVAMRAQLVPLFANTGVSIVFGGHDHTYTTTTLIDKKGKAHTRTDLNGVQYTGDGVLYITLGTMGTKYYEYKDNPVVSSKFDKDNSILHTLDSQTFGKVVVDGDTITFTGYYYNSETGELDVIGGNTLTAQNFVSKTAIIVMGVVIPVAVIAAVVATLLILKKKGKLGGKKN
ncbi:MAG: metallophosphoesterase, partial [Clostridia bacterium]|nr:metallophosphoesterase [Clostridia bacterium]